MDSKRPTDMLMLMEFKKRNNVYANGTNNPLSNVSHSIA